MIAASLLVAGVDTMLFLQLGDLRRLSCDAALLFFASSFASVSEWEVIGAHHKSSTLLLIRSEQLVCGLVGGLVQTYALDVDRDVIWVLQLLAVHLKTRAGSLLLPDKICTGSPIHIVVFD